MTIKKAVYAFILEVNKKLRLHTDNCIQKEKMNPIIAF
jgi:hypothetical protein